MLSAVRRLSTMVKVCPVAALEDNYMYIVYDEKTNKGFAVDPVEPDKLQQTADSLKVSIVGALVTHHHWDHAGGMPRFRQLWPQEEEVPIYGGDERIEKMSCHVKNDQVLDLAGLKIRCLSTPCHTRGHICYFVTDQDDSQPTVLTGDTLFVAGCGKFFEGNATEMNRNLNEVLSSLPDETAVYAGHEYTASNLKFAQHIEPTNQKILDKIKWAAERRAAGASTVPSSIGEEKETNPFMRVSSPQVQKAVGAEEPVEVMKRLREAKNTFKT